MNYSNIVKTDTYIEMSEGDNKLIMPRNRAVLVDDESGLISVKTDGSRKTIGAVYK